ncbi:MAG: MFS transporter [Candidatus Helarchaeota archaeon]
MAETSVRLYGYRWIVLLLFIMINVILQILWIGFATVTKEASYFYNVDEMGIYLLSLSFMIVYIPVTFLASWILDKYDFKVGTVIGALIIAIFGFLRIFTFGNYMLILIFQLILAVGQPFLLNSITKLSANWFPPEERTTSSGIGLISIFLGTALGLFITPLIVGGVNLIEMLNGFPHFQMMLIIYGSVSLIMGITYTIFIRNRPPTPPSSEITTEKILMFDGLKQIFRNFNFIILVIAFFVGLGIFNTILTLIEGILIPKGHYSAFAGVFGLLILLGGIVGSLVMSLLSDIYQKRKILLIISMSIATTTLFGISFSTDPIILAILGFIFGFGLVSSSPVALEFAVDVTKPVPEATSNGILMMVGQIGGILFILGLEDLKIPSTGDYFPALLVQAILLLIVLVLLLFAKEEK